MFKQHDHLVDTNTLAVFRYLYSFSLIRCERTFGWGNRKKERMKKKKFFLSLIPFLFLSFSRPFFHSTLMIDLVFNSFFNFSKVYIKYLCTYTRHWHDGYSVLQWSGRPGFNSRSSHTRNSKNGSLKPFCLTLSIIRYGSRVKWRNQGKGVAPSPTPWCSSYRKGSLWVTLDSGHQHYLLIYT